MLQTQEGTLIHASTLAAAGLPTARLLAQIHDELLFEVPEARLLAVAAAVRAVMEGTFVLWYLLLFLLRFLSTS